MKKILSYVMCLIILLLASSAMAAETAMANTITAENSIYDLIEAVPYESDKPMNRGEASYYLAQIVNGKGNENNIYFEDVKQDHPYFAYINYVFEHDLFERKNNKFYPDTQIKTRDFLEAALKLAGYSKYVDARKISYLSLMKELKISNAIISSLEKEITTENFKDILYAALTIPTYKLSGINSGSSSTVEYVIDENRMLIQSYRNIRKLEGRIVANENVHLTGYDNVRKGWLLFEDEYGVQIDLKFDKEIIISNVIGVELEIFVDNDEDTLLYYHSKRDKSERIIINSDNIDDVSTDMSHLTYYDEKGKLKTLKFSDETTFVYNGKDCYEIIPEYFKGETSRTNAIDYDGDRTFDIVFVEQYINIIVSDVNNETLSVSDLCDLITYKFVDFDSVCVIKDGKVINFSDIVNDNVISIAISLDGKIATLYVSEDIIYGNLNGKSSNSVNIDGTKYKFCCNSDISGIQLGSECIIGVNYYGYVACVKKMSGKELMYGYLVKVIHDTNSSEENTILRILTTDNEYVKLKFADKYRINGNKVEHGNITPLFMEEGKIKHQLVKYMLDANGELKMLYYAPNVNSAVMNDEFTGLHYNKHYAQGESYVRNSTVSMEYLMGPDTIRYVVATDVLGNVVEERTWCYKSSFKTTKPDMKIYDAGLNRVIGAIVVTTTVDDISKYVAMTSSNYRGFVVETKATEIDRYGDVRTFIEGWQENSLRKYYAPYGETFNNIEQGDVLILDFFDDNDVLYKYTKIFSLETDSHDGDALIADKVYSSSNIAYYNTSVSDKTSALVNVFGEIVAMSGKLSNPSKPLVIRCKGAANNTSDVACILNVNTSSVYVYYVDMDVVEVIPYSELEIGEDVFVHCREGVVTEILALR